MAQYKGQFGRFWCSRPHWLLGLESRRQSIASRDQRESCCLTGTSGSFLVAFGNKLFGLECMLLLLSQ